MACPDPAVVPGLLVEEVCRISAKATRFEEMYRYELEAELRRGAQDISVQTLCISQDPADACYRVQAGPYVEYGVIFPLRRIAYFYKPDLPVPFDKHYEPICQALTERGYSVRNESYSLGDLIENIHSGASR